MEIQEGEKREKGTEEIFEAIITENVPQINVRYQTKDPGSSSRINVPTPPYWHTPKIIIIKTLYLSISYSNCRKIKDLKNLEKNISPIEKEI